VLNENAARSNSSRKRYISISNPLLSVLAQDCLQFSPFLKRFSPVNSYADFCLVVNGKRAGLTLPRKHHSLQEFKRLAKQAKVNETRIIVKKLKSLRSSPDKPETTKHDPATIVQELESQLAALKVCCVHSEGNPVFSPTADSESSALGHRHPDPETQAESHSLRRPDRIGIRILGSPTFPSPYLLHSRAQQRRGENQEPSNKLQVLFRSSIGNSNRSPSHHRSFGRQVL